MRLSVFHCRRPAGNIDLNETAASDEVEWDYLSGARSRRFSGSTLPGVKPFLGDFACTVAISAVEPRNPHFGATHFPMAATNRALHHGLVLFFLLLVHRLSLQKLRL
jgi:hypothetical protein